MLYKELKLRLVDSFIPVPHLCYEYFHAPAQLPFSKSVSEWKQWCDWSRHYSGRIVTFICHQEMWCKLTTIGLSWAKKSGNFAIDQYILYNQSLHTGPYHSSFEIWTYDIDIFDKNSNNFWEFCGDTQSVASSSAIRLCLVGKPLFRLLTSQSNLWPHELWTPHMPHQHPRCHPASHRWHPWYVLYPTDYVHCLLYFFCGGYVISFCWISGVSLSISFRVASLVLGQSYDCPSASEETLEDMGIENTTKCKPGTWVLECITQDQFVQMRC